MEDLKKEAIVNFVRKNFFKKILKETNDIKQAKLSKFQKNIAQYLLKRSIGPNENDLILLFQDGQECLTINRKGNIVGPS